VLGPRCGTRRGTGACSGSRGGGPRGDLAGRRGLWCWRRRRLRGGFRGWFRRRGRDEGGRHGNHGRGENGGRSHRRWGRWRRRRGCGRRLRRGGRRRRNGGRNGRCRGGSGRGRRGRRWGKLDGRGRGREGRFLELPRRLEAFGKPLSLFRRKVVAILRSPVFAHLPTYPEATTITRRNIQQSPLSTLCVVGQVPNSEIRRSSK
jgi:hypothetical protein